jgi:hypothetical protein
MYEARLGSCVQRIGESMVCLNAYDHGQHGFNERRVSLRKGFACRHKPFISLGSSLSAILTLIRAERKNSACGWHSGSWYGKYFIQRVQRSPRGFASAEMTE